MTDDPRQEHRQTLWMWAQVGIAFLWAAPFYLLIRAEKDAQVATYGAFFIGLAGAWITNKIIVRIRFGREAAKSMSMVHPDDRKAQEATRYRIVPPGSSFREKR